MNEKVQEDSAADPAGDQASPYEAMVLACIDPRLQARVQDQRDDSLVHALRRMNQEQLPVRSSLYIRWKPRPPLSSEHPFRSGVREAPDHRARKRLDF